MSGKDPVRFERTTLAVRDNDVAQTFFNMVERLFARWGDESTMGLSIAEENAMAGVLALAREAIERRKHDESSSDLPPREPEDGGRGSGEHRCGGCGWCFSGASEEDSSIVGRCHVDPPVIWRGVSTWRFLRPEVLESTPACSRWKPR